MQAITLDRFGEPEDKIRLAEVDIPKASDDEVLVRVRASAADVYLWDVPPALLYIGRRAVAVRAPKTNIPGLDLAGVVEVVGADVRRFQPGDEVFGSCKGAMAEYVAVPEGRLAAKPVNLTFEQAAAVPTSGTTALQALRDHGRIESGQEVLIVGASGGVGSLAVQIAKSFGADVTGVCSTSNLDMVRDLGADRVIDYTQEDFTRSSRRYDLIIDMAGDRTLSQLRQALKGNGTLVMVGQAGIAATDQSYVKSFARWFGALALSSISTQRLRAFIRTNRQADLIALKELIEVGKVTPAVSARYPLDEAPEVIRQSTGHGRGNIIITV